MRSCIASFIPVVSQDTTSTSDSSSSSTSSIATPNPAPAWQKIGNTGLPTQNWWIQFDRKGYMYVSSNSPTVGGVSKSTDKGAHWTVINTGFVCNLHRGMGLAPDGTVFVGSDYCNSYNQGVVSQFEIAGYGGKARDVAGYGHGQTPTRPEPTRQAHCRYCYRRNRGCCQRVQAEARGQASRWRIEGRED